MDAEYRAIVSVCHAFVRPDGPAPPMPAKVDWDRVARRLLEHGVAASLSTVLPRDRFTASTLEELDRIAHRIRLRSTLLSLEIARLVPVLEACGAAPIVLKGPALAHTVHNDMNRFFADLDILVRADRVDDACRALEDQGYRSEPTARHPSFYERFHFHRKLHNRRGVHVEVHWDLTRPSDYARFDLEGLRARSREVRSPDARFRILSDADQLLHLAAQELQKGFSDLRRVLDVSLLVAQGAADDPELAERARSYGLGPALWILLSLSRIIGGVSSPPSLAQALRPGSVTRACLRALRLPERVVVDHDRQPAATRTLLLWLAAPGGKAARGAIRAFVFPGEEHYLDQGLDPTRIPRLPRRLAFALKQTVRLGKLGLYLAARVVSSSIARRGGGVSA